MPLASTLQIGREIAEGLANAQERPVHRDVKPSNVMVTTNGHGSWDFGVAGENVESTPTDHTRTVSPVPTVHAGTPQYMAPEQASGQPVTTRADLFSLGVVLYECLTGTLPFSGTTTFDYMRHVMQSPPRRLDRVAPDTPADLVDLIESCLEKTPALRPESADAVVSELRQLSDSLTSTGGTIRTAREASQNRRWKIVAAAAAGIAALVIAWQTLWPTSVTNTTWQRRPFVTSPAAESNSRVSPDGQWISFISRAAASQMVQQLTRAKRGL
jgi:serine/threonine protein kinase